MGRPRRKSNPPWTAPGLADIPSLTPRCFRTPRTDAAEIAMAAGSIVERLDIIEDVGSGEIAPFVDAFSDALFFRLLENDSATASSQQLAGLLGIRHAPVFDPRVLNGMLSRQDVRLGHQRRLGCVSPWRRGDCAMSGHSLFDRKRRGLTRCRFRLGVCRAVVVCGRPSPPILWRQTCFPQQAAKLPSLLRIAIILAAGEVGGR